MATKEYWLQLENVPWDVSPLGVDRMTGLPLSKAPGGAHRATSQQTLAVRRYTESWSRAVDEPINPWDLTELSPVQTGGSFPGALLEAKVADQIVVHYRNMDPASRTSSASTACTPMASSARRSTMAPTRCRRLIPTRPAGAGIG